MAGALDPPSLNTPAGFAGMLGAAAATTAVIFALGVLATAPAVWLVARLLPVSRGGRRRWWWHRAYPSAVVAAALWPALLPPLHAGLRGAGAPVIGAIATAGAIALWALLLVAARVRPAGPSQWTAGAGIGLTAIMLGVAAVAIGTNAAGRQRLDAGGRPNILLVSIDSLRADHVHAYGYPRQTTPTLDALAREGARFRTVVAPSSWTLPSHLTLLTGLPPEGHGVVADGQRLTERAVFLSEALWGAGYTTAGFVSAPYLDAAYGFSQGFDHYDDYTLAKRSFTDSHHGETGPVIAQLFSGWLARWEQGGSERPFFAFLHLWDAHYDYTPPPPYERLFDPDYQGSITADDFEHNPRIHAGMDPRDLAHVVALYDGEIRFVDDTLASILAELRRRGILDRTIVVVTADHGEEFFEHGRKGHKQALYDESLLVPLIIRYPRRVAAGTVVNEQVRLMDVGSTILALAGVAPPAGFGGEAGGYRARDLTPWLAAAPASRPPALPAFADLVGDAPVPLAAIRTPERKLIAERSAQPHDALFDLVRDPGEHENVIASEPKAEPALRAELSDWRHAWSTDQLSTEVALSDAHR
ncbi:MAG: sulfatase, partial [Candidatus Binatia bacterium]